MVVVLVAIFELFQLHLVTSMIPNASSFFTMHLGDALILSFTNVFSGFDITIIALCTIYSSGEPCIPLFINLKTSSMNFFPAFPDDNKNFFSQNTVLSLINGCFSKS